MANLSEQDQKEALEMLWAFFMECGGKSDPTLKLWVDKCDAFFKRLKPTEIGPKAALAMKASEAQDPDPKDNKIRVMFKTPDVVDMAIQEAIGSGTDELTEMREQIEEALSKFVRWGEQITVEFDTEVGTATVIPL